MQNQGRIYKKKQSINCRYSTDIRLQYSSYILLFGQLSIKCGLQQTIMPLSRLILGNWTEKQLIERLGEGDSAEFNLDTVIDTIIANQWII